MDARELTLNIAVNLGRIGRWACEGRVSRIRQFLSETENYIDQLGRIPKSRRFSKTFEIFYGTFNELKDSSDFDAVWAEGMFTWANILAHRASLAG
jgi:hypothetical protein